MRYVRFMGEKEIERYLKRRHLFNTTNWEEHGSRTGSVGFCFFDDSVEPEQRMEYLTGVVSMDAVAVFEPIGELNFRESMGMYRDPEKDKNLGILEFLFVKPPMMPVKEYSLTEYSYKTMRLVRLGIPKWHIDRKIIEWIHESV